jgi:hypothetical protein
MTPKQKHLQAIVAAAGIAACVVVARGLFSATPPPTTLPSAAVNLLPPLITSPKDSSKPTAVAVPYRPYLPPATVGHEPRALASDGLRKVHADRALDVPPLAEAGGSVPQEPTLAVGAPIHIDFVDPAAPPVATIAAKPDTAQTTLQTDPTAGMAPAGALLVFPPARTSPPPPLLLPIPNPTHQIGSIPANRPAVEDPPVAHIDPPGPTTLPVKS